MWKNRARLAATDTSKRPAPECQSCTSLLHMLKESRAAVVASNTSAMNWWLNAASALAVNSKSEKNEDRASKMLYASKMISGFVSDYKEDFALLLTVPSNAHAKPSLSEEISFSFDQHFVKDITEDPEPEDGPICCSVSVDGDRFVLHDDGGSVVCWDGKLFSDHPEATFATRADARAFAHAHKIDMWK